jgi:signal transduction histidine kinase
MSLMRLALRNLLSNALKHGPAGTPVRVRLSDSDHPLALVIEVSDAGMGIAPDVVPRLFDRGARGARGGHGLGLYIVRRVMELHEGRVELASNEPGRVTMRLVVVQSPAD